MTSEIIEQKVKEEKMSFSVIGMTCATCAKTVEKALSKIEGVKFAAVNLATSTGFIVAEKKIPLEVVQKTVEEVGYGNLLNHHRRLKKCVIKKQKKTYY